MSFQDARERGKPRIKNGVVVCGYCDEDEGTCTVSYPGGQSEPACIWCAESIISKGRIVKEILPRIYLCSHGEDRIVVTLDKHDAPSTPAG